VKEYRTLGAEHSSAKQEPPVFDDFPPVIGCCEQERYRSRATKSVRYLLRYHIVKQYLSQRNSAH